jgi:RNA recognition motif-containing protein
VEEEPTNQRMLFVKNLNFDTTREDLKKVFEENCKGVRSVKIASKNNLSCGFGFVEFENETFVKETLKKMQNYMLDGHMLKLSISKS